MASALRTITIDTASSPWVCVDGEKTTVNGTAETFQLYMNDLGDTATFVGGGVNATQTVKLANGRQLRFSSDKKMVNTAVLTDATACTNPGSLWVSEDDGPEVEVKMTTITVADVDATGANNLTAVTFEYPGKPWNWSWATLNMA